MNKKQKKRKQKPNKTVNCHNSSRKKTFNKKYTKQTFHFPTTRIFFPTAQKYTKYSLGEFDYICRMDTQC